MCESSLIQICSKFIVDFRQKSMLFRDGWVEEAFWLPVTKDTALFTHGSSY